MSFHDLIDSSFLLVMNNIPLSGYTMFTHSPTETHLGYIHVLADMNKEAINCVQDFV
jgi:hypothetical protein